MAEWYEVVIQYVIPVASLITAVVALFTVHYLKKQSKLTQKAFNSSKNASEIDAFLTLQENFTLNKTMSQVRSAIASKGPVTKSEGGTIETNDFFNYLEFVNRLVYYSNMEVIREENLVNAFGPTVLEIENNHYVMEHIKKMREKFGESELKGISIFAEKARKHFS